MDPSPPRKNKHFTVLYCNIHGSTPPLLNFSTVQWVQAVLGLGLGLGMQGQAELGLGV
jgi:hypothetical protein